MKAAIYAEKLQTLLMIWPLLKMCTPQETAVETFLEKVQELDPAGVGARDLQECLLLQLKRKQQNPKLF